MSSFHTLLEVAFADTQGSSAFSLDRARPYDGQPHTDAGERGKTLVEGLTMRDVKDCFVRGFLAASDLLVSELPVTDDLYGIDLNKIDPVAALQNTMCEVEKMMGIYPNVPQLKKDDSQPEGGEA